MAIGKKGQNIRLATELTGFELDMYNYEELPAFKAKLSEIRGGPVAVAVIPKEGEEEADASEQPQPSPAAGEAVEPAKEVEKPAEAADAGTQATAA